MDSMSVSDHQVAGPDGPSSMADRVYLDLRNRLLTLAIPPGAPINEDALGRELNMGRTPIREAIKRLALENLVVVFPRRGTFASEININDLRLVSEVRGVLEGFAARRAAERMDAAQRATLAQLLDELHASEGSQDRLELMELDTRVHRFVHSCTNNPYLEETLGRYLNLSLRIWYLVLDQLPHLLDRVHEHRDLLEAIQSGNGDLAAELLTEHVSRFEQEIRTVL